jgi:hypothetical protein
MIKMRTQIFYIIVLFLTLFIKGNASDSLTFKGQLSGYSHYNPANKLPWWSGGRYIPQLNYQYKLSGEKLIDFEASANLYGNAGLKLFDSANFSGNIKPYRVWARYSTDQLELRAGLQKINFGSATILRPLMWFDQVDPRDPLKLTDGVWGVLGRYYFLNNANLWLWGLYGNKNRKGWETFDSKKDIPEFGGRFQSPVPKGEAGFSYHRRNADCSILSDSLNNYNNVVENRFGLDAKFDVVVGCWVEASWSNYNKKIGIYSNQEIVNLGIDYTFGLGKGIAVIFEQLIAAYDEKPFKFKKSTTFSLLNITYPLGMFDNISAITYFDWASNKTYIFLNWQKQFNKFSLYLMGYMNPKDYNIPTQTTGETLYAGSGAQVMVVFNH